MNERIKELISQSKRLPYEHNVSLESFAELIVKECADIASQCAEWAVQNPEDHILKRFDLYKTPAELKKHFGVEE